MSEDLAPLSTEELQPALDLLATQYELIGRRSWAGMIRAGDLPSTHDEVAVRAIAEALRSAVDVKPDTFFVMHCPGWPGGIEVHPNTLEYALEFIKKHGDEKTALATWRNQYQRTDYSPEQTKAMVDAFVNGKAKSEGQQPG